MTRSEKLYGWLYIAAIMAVCLYVFNHAETPPIVKLIVLGYGTLFSAALGGALLRRN